MVEKVRSNKVQTLYISYTPKHIKIFSNLTQRINSIPEFLLLSQSHQSIYLWGRF